MKDPKRVHAKIDRKKFEFKKINLKELLLNFLFFIRNTCRMTYVLIVNTIYFLTEILTRQELALVIGFFMVLVFIEQTGPKNVEKDPGDAKHWLYRVFALILYIPTWIRLCGNSIILLTWNPKAGGLALKSLGIILMDQIYSLNRISNIVFFFFNGKVAFDGIMYTVLMTLMQMFIRKFTHKKLRIHMYVRYHSMYMSLLLFVAPTFKQIVDALFGIIAFSFLGSSPEKGYLLEWIALSSWLWFFICCALVGRGVILAALGKSFTPGSNRNFIDRLIRYHMSSFFLYPGERWSQFHMDDDDFYGGSNRYDDKD
jgi:hypothetical protein